MSEPKIFRLRLSSWHIDITLSEKGDHATYTFHAMPIYAGVGGDRLMLSEIDQTITFLEMVRDGWPKQSLVLPTELREEKRDA
jgi:hypothetical protein